MITRLDFKNFKSLRDIAISLKRITILAGLNSAGKSSVIQGILLSKSLIDHLHNKESSEIAEISKFPLNGAYLLSLGSAIDVISKDTGKQFEIGITDQYNGRTNLFKNVFFTSESLSENVFDINVKVAEKYKDSFLYNNTLYYLNAERLGPRIRHWVNEKGGDINCGYRGEYTVEVLAHTKANPEFEVAESKILEKRKLEGFQDIPKYARAWMEFITPGTDIGDANIIGKIRSAEISLSGNTPPNVGFGISYALPIVVTGLLAKPNSILIVENPEAHLHPKGQSNLGYFLGQIASSGVQVVIETHSEHIVNGIRRAAIKLDSISPSDMTISFFRGISDDKISIIQPIEVNSEATLSDFPVDFFDQVNQDMADIAKSKRLRNGQSTNS